MSRRRRMVQRLDGWRRRAAHLALFLTFFAVIQPALATTHVPGGLKFRDEETSISAAPDGLLAHDHNHRLCHSCAGHICLEQHGAFDLAPAPLAILPAIIILVPPTEIAAAWPHPPTGPPLFLPPRPWQARAPPSLLS